MQAQWYIPSVFQAAHLVYCTSGTFYESRLPFLVDRHSCETRQRDARGKRMLRLYVI
jgi:hypothetical protein